MLLQQLEITIQRRQRCAQLMAGKGQELVLEVVEAALGDVTYGDDSAEFFTQATNRLPVRLEVAVPAVVLVKCELHEEGFTPCRPPLGCGLGWQRIAFCILGREGSRRVAEHPNIRLVRQQRRSGWIDHQDGVSQTRENGHQPRSLGLTDPVLLRRGVGQRARFLGTHEERVVAEPQLLDSRLQLLVHSFELFVARL
jgi:hypothetical protein